jgi:hypothetical protein
LADPYKTATHRKEKKGKNPMLLRLKVWPSHELAKTTFTVDSKVIEFRRAEIDLRTFPAVSSLTAYSRSLLWDDFFRNDSHAYDRVGEITTSNVACWSEDSAVLHEWINHLFKEALSRLNNEWAQSNNTPSEDYGF